MYLFNRRLRLARGSLLDSQDWAARMTEKVNSLSEVEVSLWTPCFSPSVGTLSWIAVVEELAQMEALTAKSNADEGYAALADEGAAFNSGDPVDDGLVKLVLADPDGADDQYSSVVTTQPAPGQILAGIELGVEIAQRAKAITGCATSFATAVTGPYGAVAWFTTYPSIEKAQQAQDALAADSGFARMIDERASQAYAAGAGETTMWRRAI